MRLMLDILRYVSFWSTGLRWEFAGRCICTCVCTCICEYAYACVYFYVYMCICTVYPKKCARGFCCAVFCCGCALTDFPMSVGVVSLALRQSNDCPSAGEAALMNMDKYFTWIHYERLHSRGRVERDRAVCVFLGIYCMCIAGPLSG